MPIMISRELFFWKRWTSYSHTSSLLHHCHISLCFVLSVGRRQSRDGFLKSLQCRHRQLMHFFGPRLCTLLLSEHSVCFLAPAPVLWSHYCLFVCLSVCWKQSDRGHAGVWNWNWNLELPMMSTCKWSPGLWAQTGCTLPFSEHDVRSQGPAPVFWSHEGDGHPVEPVSEETASQQVSLFMLNTATDKEKHNKDIHPLTTKTDGNESNIYVQ